MIPAGLRSRLAPAFLLLLLAACGAAGPGAAWRERLRDLRPGSSRREVEDLLESLVRADPHRPRLLRGAPTGPLPPADVYALDDDAALRAAWGPSGLRSADVVVFSSLRDRTGAADFDAVAAIHRSPSAQGGLAFDPVPLIRAVNTLHALGRERTLSAIRAYAALAASMDAEEIRTYAVDPSRILPLLRLLFEPPGGEPGDVGLGRPDLAAPGSEHWPCFPMILVYDVPFMIVSGYDPVPPVPGPLRLPAGPMRDAPLAPSATPLEAADALTESEAWRALRLGPGDYGRKRWLVRRQALAAAAGGFTPRADEGGSDCCADLSETQWRAMLARSNEAGLVWSAERQDFIAGR